MVPPSSGSASGISRRRRRRWRQTAKKRIGIVNASASSAERRDICYGMCVCVCGRKPSFVVSSAEEKSKNRTRGKCPGNMSYMKRRNAKKPCTYTKHNSKEGFVRFFVLFGHLLHASLPSARLPLSIGCETYPPFSIALRIPPPPPPLHRRLTTTLTDVPTPFRGPRPRFARPDYFFLFLGPSPSPLSPPSIRNAPHTTHTPRLRPTFPFFYPRSSQESACVFSSPQQDFGFVPPPCARSCPLVSSCRRI